MTRERCCNIMVHSATASSQTVLALRCITCDSIRRPVFSTNQCKHTQIWITTQKLPSALSLVSSSIHMFMQFCLRNAMKTYQKLVQQKFNYSIFYILIGRLQCVGHSFAYVAHLVFLRDGRIRTQRAAVASTGAHQLSLPSPKMLFLTVIGPNLISQNNIFLHKFLKYLFRLFFVYFQLLIMTSH